MENISPEQFSFAVGQRIRALMLARGITEEVAAMRMGVSTSSIWNWKSGNVMIPLYRAWQLAILLNVPLELLLPEPLRLERKLKQPKGGPHEEA